MHNILFIELSRGNADSSTVTIQYVMELNYNMANGKGTF